MTATAGYLFEGADWPADLPVVQSTKFELVDAKPRLSMSGFTKACVRRQREDFRVRKSGCKRVANPRAPAGAIREAIAPYGRYNAASLPKVQSTGYLDTVQNKAAVALPTPMSAGSPGVPPRDSQNQGYISMT